jgi:curved DNA-binding protein CbpA
VRILADDGLLMSIASRDWYEVLQVSPAADPDTILRVFRHLAKRYHPDNVESGNPERFNLLVAAFRVLSDPEERARYDAIYESEREHRWRIFDQASAENDVAGDRQLRAGVLKLLYSARRNDPDNPGLGAVHIENLLSCPETHLKFHIWYLRENGWIQRLENGMLAITAAGVDRVLDDGMSHPARVARLEPGHDDPSMNGQD